jgi:hypothetical protein
LHRLRSFGKAFGTPRCHGTYEELLAAPAMTWEDTLGNIQTQDAWRAAIGLEYEGERASGPNPPLPLPGGDLL